MSANYIDNGIFEEDSDKRWSISEVSKENFILIIPSNAKMASVIDGQHRLLGYEHCRPERKEMDLLCAVYMDLPQPYQAYLFATININQRKVDKSLAYDQFGYNLDDENPQGWSPDKLAVFITRKLNLDPKSPFYTKIRIAPLDDDHLFAEGDHSSWKVSTACIVEGISRLISTNAKKDRDNLHRYPVSHRSRKKLGDDQAPLRTVYLEGKDDELRQIITNYFSIVKEKLWIPLTRSSDDSSPRRTSYITRTVGLQALFDVLRYCIKGNALTENRVTEMMSQSSRIDFSDSFFQASGKGRVRVKNSLLLAGGLIMPEDIGGTDVVLYKELLTRYNLVA